MGIKRLIVDEGVSGHTAIIPIVKKSAVDYRKLELLTDDQKKALRSVYGDSEEALEEAISDMKKMLDLIYQNLEEANDEPYTYEETKVTISYGGELFTAVGVRNLNLGWKKHRPDETKECILPMFGVDDPVEIEGVFIKEYSSEPPQRYSDGDLLQAMEIAGKDSKCQDEKQSGIGTVATRSRIIDSLEKKEFVKRIGEKPERLVPTELANLLYSILPNNLKSAELTANWESRLEEVEHGTLAPEEFMKQIEKFIAEIVEPYQDN